MIASETHTRAKQTLKKNQPRLSTYGFGQRCANCATGYANFLLTRANAPSFFGKLVASRYAINFVSCLASIGCVFGCVYCSFLKKNLQQITVYYSIA